MSDIIFDSDMHVVLVDNMGDDERIAQAARVSTKGSSSLQGDGKGVEGLINFLMKNRHGTPFEHCFMTMLITVPIFVWREHMRHRMASYNEESGRYKVLEPRFYVPVSSRPLQQIGKTGHYDFVAGTLEQQAAVQNHLKHGFERCYNSYQELLKLNVAKEVARMVLPVSIYSSAYVTINLRSLMNFLSLRTKDPDSFFPSFPQYEIEQAAKKMEILFRALYPLTAQAFVNNGRVAP